MAMIVDLPVELFHIILQFLQVHQVIGISRVSKYFRDETVHHLSIRSNRRRRLTGSAKLLVNADKILTVQWYKQFGSRPLHDAVMYSNIHDLHFDFGEFNHFERHFPFNHEHCVAWLQFVHHSWHQFQPITNEVFSPTFLFCSKPATILYTAWTRGDVSDPRTYYSAKKVKRTRIAYLWPFILKLSFEDKYPDHYQVIHEFMEFIVPSQIPAEYSGGCEKRIRGILRDLFGQNFHSLHLEGGYATGTFGLVFFRRAILRRLTQAAIMSTNWKWYNPYCHTWENAAVAASPLNISTVVNSVMKHVSFEDLIRLTSVSKMWDVAAKEEMKKRRGTLSLLQYANCKRFPMGACLDAHLYLQRYAPMVFATPPNMYALPNPTWERYKHERALSDFVPFNHHSALRIHVGEYAVVKYAAHPDDSFRFLETLTLQDNTALRHLDNGDQTERNVEMQIKTFLLHIFPNQETDIDLLVITSDTLPRIYSIDPVPYKRLFHKFGLTFNPRYWPFDTTNYLLESSTRSECFLRLSLLLRLCFMRNAKMTMAWGHFDPRIYTLARAMDTNWGFNLARYHKEDEKPCIAFPLV